MATRPVDTDTIEQLFARVIANQSDLQMLYCTSNVPWYDTGGFTVFVPEYTPDRSWDNTSRNWFIGAKDKQGALSIARPYNDVITGQLITALSLNVYDEAGNDIGVVSADVSMAFLSGMLGTAAGLPGEQTFFINNEGLYMTHPDEEAVLTRSFFTDFGLERYQNAVLDSTNFVAIAASYYLHADFIPEADRFLVTVIPTQAIYADTNRVITRLVAFNIALLVIVCAVAVILIRILRRDRAEITTINHLLTAERDEIAAMKDNLKTGIFLMDKDGVIQPNYSRSFEQTIGAHSLNQKKFTELLSDSFKPNDLTLIKDFFDMVRDRVRPQIQLDRINPLEELSYTSIETHAEKTLRCRFVPVERNDDVFLLGTVDDITEETQLRKMLDEEEAKRQEEMRSLFELVHVEPAILIAFTEDATHNLEQGVELLCGMVDSDCDKAATLVHLYQLLHATKSDSYIVGLRVYGDKLHGIESEIKRLRDNSADAPLVITPDELDSLVARMEEMLAEKDKLLNTFEQLHMYEPIEKQDATSVLLSSLQQACERVADDLGKQARFRPGVVDDDAMKAAPRRELKDILVQLVRNAVYHGIEMPKQRSAAGKNTTGVVHFSMKRQDATAAMPSGSYIITIQDDGAGLNFESIRRKALERGLIGEGENDRGKLLRAMFLPGFSTAESEGAHAGRGIGLNLVQDEVRGLHGSIKVRTEAGKGTAFIITIPQ
jgi:two-component system chemotaxis sensor kinase CheA